MKRDIDLIRKILLAFEASKTGYEPDDLAKVVDSDEVTVGYQCMLIVHAGWAVGKPSDAPPVIDEFYSRADTLKYLTFEGHEFIELIRDDARWTLAKAAVQSLCGCLPVELLRKHLSGISIAPVAA